RGMYASQIIIQGSAEAACYKTVNDFNAARPLDDSGPNVVIPGAHVSCFECQAQSLFALPKGLLCTLLFQELPHLASDAADHCQQRIVWLADLRTEELHDADEFLTGEYRECEGGMEFCGNRKRSAREVVIFGDIRNPHRLHARPYAPRHTNSGREGALEADRLEFAGVCQS